MMSRDGEPQAPSECGSALPPLSSFSGGRKSGSELPHAKGLRPGDHGYIALYHVLKSLTYFDDAESEPMSVMLVPFDWKECKAFFVREAHAIVLP